jgi:hypothetical protein
MAGSNLQFLLLLQYDDAIAAPVDKNLSDSLQPMITVERLSAS